MATSYVSVALDVVARGLPESFTYAAGMPLEIGMAVAVPFGKRQVAGYVIDIQSVLPREIEPQKIKPVRRVLSLPTFSASSVSLARWIATTYAAPFISALKLFLPPGFARSVKEAEKQGTSVADCSDATIIMVALTDGADAELLRDGAHRQREVLNALLDEPLGMQELRALVPGATTVVKALEKRGFVRTFEKKLTRFSSTTNLSSAKAPRPESLTAGQRDALCAISHAKGLHAGNVVLVDGVTGSGKTEVYLEAIEDTIEEGKRAIVLVPEIALTAQTVGRFNARFKGRVGLLHSRMSDKERAEQWWRIKRGACDVVIGPRSALFAPVENIGLLVIDEEHETSYKQESAPRYHARDVARELVRQVGATLVLGSATPSEEALYLSEHDSGWKRIRMQERPGEASLPEVEIVDMRGSDLVFSEKLTEALKDTNAKGKKSILLLNRRGFATFLMCEDCGCVPTCPHCSTSLTYHAKQSVLMCHTCGRSWSFQAYPDPRSQCPNCRSRYLKQIGSGTERIEAELKGLLPKAPIIRMDADTTRGKDAHAKLLEEFDKSPGSVLLGTQMIAKGLDFPEVTLVGVINADVSLKLPDFRAPEQTYHLLEQVAGRAGRGEGKGRVLIQTSWPEHPVFQAVSSHRRELFLEPDKLQRKEASYPPYKRLANVIVSSTNKSNVQSIVQALFNNLKLQLEGSEGYEILGPSACIKEKVKDKHRFHVMLKAPRNAQLGLLITSALAKLDTRGASVAVDIDAYNTF